MSSKNPIEWSARYLIGDEQIDNQHRTFFQKALRVQVAAKLGRGDDEIKAAIEFMRDYAEVHFEDEAALMRECEYPHMQTHLEEHAIFLDQVRALEEEFEGSDNRAEVAERTVDTAIRWFTRHIQRADQPLADYLRKHGARG